MKTNTAFYHIKKIRYKDTVYYYLYKEWYDPDARKKRSKLSVAVISWRRSLNQRKVKKIIGAGGGI